MTFPYEQYAEYVEKINEELDWAIDEQGADRIRSHIVEMSSMVLTLKEQEYANLHPNQRMPHLPTEQRHAQCPVAPPDLD